MMTTMLSTEKQEMYEKMVLIIPDLVLPQDIPTIINWFNYYGIADVRNVDFRDHPEQEYYVEDRSFYGYAVIEIREWYKNNSSLSFYENLIAGNAKMVYEDPEYWDVKFYEPRTQEEENVITQNLEEKFDQVADIDDDDDGEYYSEEEYWVAEAQEAKEHMESELQEDDDDDEDEDEDEDDPYDEDYEFEETDEEEDSKYEYVALKRDKMETRSKTKRKEDKSKTTNLNTENITLEELIVKKNKNYVKRDKRKSYKNVWIRRLRQKLDA